MSKELKAVVIDDDNDRISQIMNVMPDYVSATASRFSKDAQKLIARADGTTADLLIMYADDPRAISLYIFDWMRKDPNRLGMRNIPVVIYTDDAYSDRVMEFLEIDDVFIHEGEVDDRGFFSVLLEAIECAENRSEEFYDAALPEGGHGSAYAAYDDEEQSDEVIDKILKNNPEKLMGQSLFVSTGENNVQRSMVINDDDRMKSVLESIKDSREKTYQFRLIMNETEADRLEREKFLQEYYPHNSFVKGDTSPIGQSIDRIKDENPENLEASHSGIAEGPLLSGAVQDAPTAFSQDGATSSAIIHGHKIDIVKGKIGNVSSTLTEIPSHSVEYAGKPERTGEPHIINTAKYNTSAPDDNAAANPHAAQNKVSSAPKPLGNANKPDETAAHDKIKVLVVDTDIRTKLSMQYHYADRLSIEFADSGMKAIDSYIQQKPDIVMIEYDMPYMSGITILENIRRQPNGSNITAVMLIDVAKHADIVSTLSANSGINGIIYKPFSKDQFIGVMQRFIP